MVLVLRTLVGYRPAYGALYAGWGHLTDSRHRAECELLGVFPRVWAGEDLPWRLNDIDLDQVRLAFINQLIHSPFNSLQYHTPG